MRKNFLTILLLAFALLVPAALSAADWQLIGPEGGDVRSLASDPSDPNRILLGTSAGQMFQSLDGGKSWASFAHLGPGDDYVLDHIVFDPTHPATIYVAGWSLFNADEGDVFRSEDGGKTWHPIDGVHNKSVRTLGMAPSDHNTLVIGALDGVFRSRDAGATWQRLSPEGHPDIKNIESLAIDPKNPDVIYVGTWHLPWKTDDAGKNWHRINEGVLDDSDVFSIIVDPNTPQTVYASACSGIYKSENSGELFHRIKGIPHSAIRTRVLKQDPKQPLIVYAGTTGGLWKTEDGGNKWELYSASDVIVNDILIDPSNPDHVIVATDKGGVLVSNNGFEQYAPSNRGFSHRVVGAMLADRKDPNRLYVGVVNDKELGGFFASEDGGKSWALRNRGLNERDVLALQQAENGVIFAGTNHGIFSLPSAASTWLPAAMINGPLPEAEKKEPTAEPASKKAGESKSARTRAAARHAPARTSARARKPVHETVIPISTAPRVRAIQVSGGTWYAATNAGLFVSVDSGKKWYGQPVLGELDLLGLTTAGDGTVTVVTWKRAFMTKDAGKSWAELKVPQYVTGIYSISSTPDGSFWLGTREGALHSTDGGETWDHMLGGLPTREVLGVRSDEAGKRLLATALRSRGVFESLDNGKSWRPTPPATVSIRAAIDYQGRLLAASAYNGLLLQERNEVAAGADPAAVPSDPTAVSRP